MLFLTVQQDLKSSSVDTELRLDGLLALELWDRIVSVLGNVSRASDRSGKPESDDHKHHKPDTITIGPEGMISCFLQWNNSQSGNSFNSILEKHHVSNFPNPIQTLSNL